MSEPRLELSWDDNNVLHVMLRVDNEWISVFERQYHGEEAEGLDRGQFENNMLNTIEMFRKFKELLDKDE